MPTVRQTNFSGGELDPKLWGRTDHPKFAVGLRRLKNFFALKSGAAVSRPGTTLVRETKNNGAVRLIPFVYSDAQAYVLEVGSGYIRFHTDGGTVLSAGVPYEVATPYSAFDLDTLMWCQSGDVLTITSPGHPPKELKRLAPTNWTLTDVSFAAAPPFFMTLASPYGTHLNPPMAIDSTLLAEDGSHPMQEWTWKVTAVVQSSVDGTIRETLPVTVANKCDGANPASIAAIDSTVVLYPDRRVMLLMPPVGGGWPTPSLPAEWANLKPIAYNYYRGRGELFGFVAQSKAVVFHDIGREPNYLIQPPLGKNPFEVFSPATGTLLRTENPVSSVYFQDRRIFAGTLYRPGHIFASRSSDYDNFDDHFVPAPGDALVFELATRKRESIRSLLVMDRLLVFTNSSVWSIAGQQGDPLDIDSIDARVIEEIGASFLPPLVVDGCGLFVRVKGRGVRALIPAANPSGFVGVDLSALAQHVFGSKLAKDWTYQEDPFGLVWVVLSDGTLASLTFSREDEVWAWARHETDGSVERICAIPETDEDYVYMVVRRTINGVTKRFIERMTSRITKNLPSDDICLDCAANYVGTPTTTITGLSHLEGKEVWVTGKGNPVFGPLTVFSGQITLPDVPEANYPPMVSLWVGLRFQPEIETLDVASASVRNRQKTVTSVGFEVDNSKGIWAGQDFEHLVEWRQRLVAANYGIIGSATELVRIAVTGKWDEAARAALRQTLPLPITVLGIAREVDVGG